MLAPKVEVSAARQTYYEPISLDTLDTDMPVQKEIQQRNAEMQQQEQIPPINEPPADAHAQDMLNKYGDM